MKKLLLWLCIAFPILGAAQGSYFNIEVQFDEYGPDESFIVVTSQNDTLVNHTPSNPYEFFSTLVFTDAGEITISLFDNWGDGWQDGNDAFRGVIISNECQGEILNLDANFNFDQYDQVINLLPCPPPSFEGFTSSNASQQCLTGGQALIVFEWETDSYAVPIKVFYSNENGLGPLEYQIPPSANNFAVYAGNGQMPPNWSVEHYLQVEFSDGNISENIAYTPFSCIEGCTDPNQTSYNPWATIDDGSCSGTTCDTDTQYQITMEITFDNWPNETSWIMNSGGIIGEAAPGTYSYNDIGQTYTYSFCVNQGAGFELIVNDTYGDGMAGSTSGGDIDGTIVIYDCNGDIIWEMDNPDFGNVLYSGNQVGVQCEVAEEIYGCTNPNYLEYNPDATIDDGSCATEHVLGCMDENSINYNPDATKQELIPVCNYNLIIKDAAADGWGNSFIGVSQGGVSLGTYTMGPGLSEQVFPLNLSSSEPVKVYYFEVGGLQQPPQQVQFQTWHNSFLIEDLEGEILMYEGENPFENNGQGALQSFDAPFWVVYEAMPYCGDVCIPIVEGCTDPDSLNYNPDANVDDGSCIPIIYGCMNDLAFNYNPDATVDDGSCEEVIVGCMDPAAFNYNPDANTAGDCIPVVEGCMNDLAFNYNPNANVDDGSCVPVVYGCTDPTAFNYNPDANTDNGSCVEVVYGCTNPESLNYNPLANTDNGTCINPVSGCTDVNAYNYDPTANVSDPEACLYDAGCITGPGEPYWLNNNCYAWVIDVDSYCCDNDWDPVCQEMYNYCENGWPDGIDIDGKFNRFTGIMVYPNPTEGVINISSGGLDIKYTVYDLLGKTVVKDSNKPQLDLSNVEAGVYFLQIVHEGQVYNKRIIIE